MDLLRLSEAEVEQEWLFLESESPSEMLLQSRTIGSPSIDLQGNVLIVLAGVLITVLASSFLQINLRLLVSYTWYLL